LPPVCPGLPRSLHFAPVSLVEALSPANVWAGTALVVERTLAWLNRFRRLTIRYERRADIHEAFLQLGCILICWNFIHLNGFC
jgi:hypothetical protein